MNIVNYLSNIDFSNFNYLGLILLLFLLAANIVLAHIINKGFVEKKGHIMGSFYWGYFYGFFMLEAPLYILMIPVMLPSLAELFYFVPLGVLISGMGFGFVLRKRWAWIWGTIASCNPIIYIINYLYLSKRWYEEPH